MNLKKPKIKGDIKDDPITLTSYSFDASLYKVRPKLVAFPKDEEDILEIIQFAKRNSLPVTPRAAGTGLAGAAIGEGIVVDTSKYMRRIVDLFEQGGRYFVIVEPGVVYKDLQKYLEKRGLFLPPEPSSSEICMIGGNVGTKASGAHSVKYGTVDRYITDVRFLNERFGLVDTSKDLPKELYEKVESLRDRIRSDERLSNPVLKKKGMKVGSGYNLFSFFDFYDPKDVVTHLMSGSVGTLGIFSRMTFEVLPKKKGVSTILVYFLDLFEACSAVSIIKKLGPYTLELVNSLSLSLVKKRYKDLLIPSGYHMLLVEFEGEERKEKEKELLDLLVGKYKIWEKPFLEEDEKRREDLWRARKSIVSILNRYSKDLKSEAYLDDVALPEEKLPNFIEDLCEIFSKYDLVFGVYGHVGDGNLHIRPLINLNLPEHRKILEKVVSEVYERLFSYGGCMASEHGMGRIRAPYLKKEWGDEIYYFMKEIKDLFDPKDIFNPDVIFSEKSILSNLKYPIRYVSDLDSPCTSCGYCKGVCPIWEIRGGEEGARAYLAVIREKEAGKLKKIENFIGECLGCGRCSFRCPSGADPKELVIYERAKNPSSFERIGPFIKPLSKNFSSVKKFLNFFAKFEPDKNPILRGGISSFTNIFGWIFSLSPIEKDEYLPALRKKDIDEVFSKALSGYEPKARKKVSIFLGCASTFFYDNILLSLVEILKDEGVSISLPSQSCCGLPHYGKGYIEHAKFCAKGIIDRYLFESPDLIISTCASCTYMLKLYPKLFLDDPLYHKRAKRFSDLVVDSVEFLYQLDFKRKRNSLKVSYHDPCHHISLGIKDEPRSILSSFSELLELDDGCCGGAGTYMFTHKENSIKIFYKKLPSIVKKDPDIIVTSCPGCILQFRRELKRKKIPKEVLHILEFLRKFW